MIFTEEDQTKYWSEKTYHILACEFIEGEKNYCKVRDHCQYTGKYLGTAYSICNIHYNKNSFIPVMAHKASA